MNRFALVCAVLVASASTLLAQPKLSLEKPEIDLGIVYSGAMKKGTIGIRNIGTKPLRIYNVQPACGCTAVRRPKEVLDPNESDYIEIEFNTSGYRGRVEKELFITSSDSTAQYVSVRILADVREELEPASRSNLIWMGNIPVGSSVTRKVAFRNVSGRTISVLGAGSAAANITVEADKKSVAALDSVVLTINARAMKPFYSNEPLWLDVDSKNQPRITLHVSFVGVQP
jgi:hypothetical protein